VVNDPTNKFIFGDEKVELEGVVVVFVVVGVDGIEVEGLEATAWKLCASDVPPEVAGVLAALALVIIVAVLVPLSYKYCGRQRQT